MALARRLALLLDARNVQNVQIWAPRSLAGPKADATQDAEIHFFNRLADSLRECFSACSCHIFITATGIAVRCIAPLLKDKTRDPAVLVVDQRARFVISLLSGHLGGGNAMAAKVADLLGATAVITTATDVEGLPALDLLAGEKGLAIGNLDGVKAVSAALLAGEPVGLDDPGNLLGLRHSRWAGLFRDIAHETAAGIVVTEQARLPERAAPRLLLHPPSLVAGVGCRRGTPARDILGHIRAVFAQAGLALSSLAGLASLDAKKDEHGLLEAAETLAVPLSVFTPEELSHYPVSRPSPKAQERFGLPGVCEPAALAAAGEGGVLLVPKSASGAVTVAVARRRLL